MFELIIFFTMAGNVDIIASDKYSTDMDCAYNQGVWVQHYVERYDGKVLEIEGADVDDDGHMDFTSVQMVISKDGNVGTLDLVCVTGAKVTEVRASNER